MTERPSAAQSRAPAKAAALAALIASAVIAVQPLTSSSEGEVYRAYPDSGGVWTICKGHTGPEVHAGLVASKAQCAAWYRGDMTAHMEDALRATPELAEQRSALQAAGDFSFNAGGGWWRRSPMAAAFAQRR
jgi:lysozyme